MFYICIMNIDYFPDVENDIAKSELKVVNPSIHFKEYDIQNKDILHIIDCVSSLPMSVIKLDNKYGDNIPLNLMVDFFNENKEHSLAMIKDVNIVKGLCKFVRSHIVYLLRLNLTLKDLCYIFYGDLSSNSHLRLELDSYCNSILRKAEGSPQTLERLTLHVIKAFRNVLKRNEECFKDLKLYKKRKLNLDNCGKIYVDVPYVSNTVPYKFLIYKYCSLARQRKLSLNYLSTILNSHYSSNVTAVRKSLFKFFTTDRKVEDNILHTVFKRVANKFHFTDVSEYDLNKDLIKYIDMLCEPIMSYKYFLMYYNREFTIDESNEVFFKKYYEIARCLINKEFTATDLSTALRNVCLSNPDKYGSSNYPQITNTEITRRFSSGIKTGIDPVFTDMILDLDLDSVQTINNYGGVVLFK